MRIGFVVLLALTLGLATAMAATVSEFGYELVNPSLAAVTPAPMPKITGPPPKVVVKEPIHEFGEMDPMSVGRHTFVIENAGPGTLELKPGHPECTCTIASVSRSVVPPGETAEVTVEWSPKNPLAFGEMKKSVTFPTNDPNRQSLVLTVHGILVGNTRLEPASHNFYDFSTRETREATSKLLVYRGEKFEILGHKWGNDKTGEHFGFLYEEIPAAELAAMKPTPKSGYKLTFVARKGMPAGPLVQTMTLETKPKTPTPITVSMYGHVSSDITLIGPVDFKPQLSLLYLGSVPLGTAREVNMSAMLIGEHRNDTKFEVVKVLPEELEVTFGKPVPNPAGTSSRMPIKIVLPATAKQQAWLSAKPEEMGYIVIKTTHPDYKEIKILVRGEVIAPKGAGAK